MCANAPTRISLDEALSELLAGPARSVFVAPSPQSGAWNDVTELVPRHEPIAARVAALAAGALAAGALAIGVFAIARLAIGKLAVRDARFRKVTIDELTVKRLRVLEDRDSARLSARPGFSDNAEQH
jgi:hypothetical protein